MRAIPIFLLVALMLQGCVSRQPDHFYVLDPEPPLIRPSGSPFTQQIIMRLTVPAVNDRAEMVVVSSGGVAILEHERWAAPLADLARAALAREIEQKRADVLVLPRSAEDGKLALIRMAVDIDQISAEIGKQVSIEAHWRVTIVATGAVAVGRDAFSVPLQTDSHALLAAGLNSCLGLLANRLIREIPAAAP